jgi:hypothetical protein
VVNARPWPLYPPSGKDPEPLVKETWCVPGLVWMGVRSLAPPGFSPQTVQPIAVHYMDYSVLAPETTHYIG